MAAATAALLASEKTAHQEKPSEKKLTLKGFLREYSDMEDGYKYEFSEGTVEKTIRTMTPAQTFILNNLMRHYSSTKAFAKGANLFVEVEMLTKPKQLRKPDISYRSVEQIISGDYSLSEFAIEVMSPSDNLHRVRQKVREYFEGGMKVLWHIFPNEQEVEVFTSYKSSIIYAGDEIVSAAPAIPDFTMKVEDIFVKPTLPIEQKNA